MNHLITKKGLSLPIEGDPVKYFKEPIVAKVSSLDLSFHPLLKARLLVDIGDVVKKGQAVVVDKACEGLQFTSPVHGKVLEIRRGHRRRVLSIVFERIGDEAIEVRDIPDVYSASRDQFLDFMKEKGAFSFLFRRPFGYLANPKEVPRSIFIKAIDSAPFAPKATEILKGSEELFQAGVEILRKLTSGSLYLLTCKEEASLFEQMHSKAEIKTVQGPYPVSNPSVHIQWLDPIVSKDDVIWTIDIFGVMNLGKLFTDGCFLEEKLISIAGSQILQEKRGFYKVSIGAEVNELINDKLKEGLSTLISGDVFTGSIVNKRDFIRLHDHVLTAIEKEPQRKFLHFMRVKSKRFSATKTYLRGWFQKKYCFSDSLHGELRPFIDGSLYENVIPFRIPVMHLVKAVLSRDFEMAERLGFLEIIPEDLALATFICPSKIELVEILREGQRLYYEEMCISS